MNTEAEHASHTAVVAVESDLDRIIAEITQEYTGTLPEQALRDAQLQKGRINSRLIELIRNATEIVRSGGELANDGSLFALFLLAEFEAKEALPAIVESVTLPGEGCFALYGDTITEDFPRIFAILADDMPELIDQLIADRSINEYVRSAAARSLVCLVRDGKLLRTDMIERLRSHLLTAISNRDAQGAETLAVHYYFCQLRELLPEIRQAFASGLFDAPEITLKEVENFLESDEEASSSCWELRRPTKISDTIEELKAWSCFNPDKRFPSVFGNEPATFENLDWGNNLSPEGFNLDDEDDENDVLDQMAAHPVTVRYDGSNVGRNEACPCGSGKKFKKCCGSRR